MMASKVMLRGGVDGTTVAMTIKTIIALGKKTISATISMTTMMNTRVMLK